MFSIVNRTRVKPPSIKLAKIAQYILGENYDLSVVFIPPRQSKNLNKKYRAKNKVANVLSFPLTSTSGEIFLTPRQILREAKNQNHDYFTYLTYLFIHGALHLKGLDHGSKMDAAEIKIAEFFGLVWPKTLLPASTSARRRSKSLSAKRLKTTRRAS